MKDRARVPVTPPTTVRDSRYWRFKAEEARTRASNFTSAAAREIMEDVARSYDLLAHRAERRERRLSGDEVRGA
jgi:hypothetical protein